MGPIPKEGKRMVSGFIGNEVPRKGLRVRVSCPPLFSPMLQMTESDQCQRKKTVMIAVNIHASVKTSTSFFF